MKKVLITGGCGFIGRNLVELLLKETDWRINILDKSTKNCDFDKQRVTLFKGDITKKEDIKKAIYGCDYVVNLAAQTGVIPSIEDPIKDAEINIMGLLNLLMIAKETGVKGFVQASSAAPLGEQKPPLTEDKLPKPLSPYGASKLAGEAYCSAFSASYGLRTVCLRFSNVYGRYSEKKQSAIHAFLRNAIQDKPITVFGDGKQTRDFINAKDVALAIKLALEKKATGLYQIGTGKETSLLELITIIKQVSGKDIHIEFKPERPGEIRRNFVSIEKARKELNFEPKISLNDGLRELYNQSNDKKHTG